MDNRGMWLVVIWSEERLSHDHQSLPDLNAQCSRCVSDCASPIETFCVSLDAIYKVLCKATVGRKSRHKYVLIL